MTHLISVSPGENGESEHVEKSWQTISAQFKVSIKSCEYNVILSINYKHWSQMTNLGYIC